MSSGRQDFDTNGSQSDEGYWSALLSEGEHARSVFTDGDVQIEKTTPRHNGSGLAAAAVDTAEQTAQDWQEVAHICQNDGLLELKVAGYNRGGLLVEWRSLRGFVPASQLVNFPATHDSHTRQAALMERVGQMLRLRVIELEPEKNRLILSERAAKVAAGQRSEVLGRLQAGDRVRGQVTNLCDFGVFVDLGGVEGLIHISELSWGRVAHPENIVRRDQTVEVYVLDVDPEAARVALSLKRLHPDPWKTVAERYGVGQIIEGQVTHVVDFGAFVCIEEGLEGLIHISELAEGHFLHPRNVVAEGDLVKARILSIDGRSRRLGLSLRLV